MAIKYGSTCASVVADLASAGRNISTTQFLSWNPNISGLCDQLLGQFVCTGLPGGSYVPPPAPNSTSTDGSRQRGGGPGRSVRGGRRNATIVPIGSRQPSPTQSGISPLCTEYVVAEPGDGCQSLTDLWRVPEPVFFDWNPVLGQNGEHCQGQLFAGYLYCIDIARRSTTSATTSVLPTSTAAPPGPTQSGIASNCNRFAEAIPGKGCYDFAVAEGITPAQLYAWNAILGPNGEHCDSQFWANEYYCVGVSTSSARTTGAHVAAPSPQNT